MKKFRQILAFFLVLSMLSGDISAIAEGIATLTLPSALKVIEEDAFYGDTSLEKVIVPDGATEIQARAFANSSLSAVELPGTLTYIAEDAFDNCTVDTIEVPRDTYAYDRLVELGLIIVPSDGAYPESEHPYADETDFTWVYDSGSAESLTITFSPETETEEGFDFIYIYDLNDVKIGEYTGRQLAGKSVTVEGSGFKIRLVSDDPMSEDDLNTYYGFKITEITEKLSMPLELTAIDAASDSVGVGEEILWTVSTNGGKGALTYDYEVLCGNEIVWDLLGSDSAEVSFVPEEFGSYVLSVVVHDEADVTFGPVESESVTVGVSTALPESAHNYAANSDLTWYYAAEPNVDGMLLHFSAETKVESNRDFIYIYNEDGSLQGKYTSTALANQTIEVIGNRFSIRLTSNGSGQYYGFAVTSIEKTYADPLAFESLSVSKTKVAAGTTVTWSFVTNGGRRPVMYDYSVIYAVTGEEVIGGSVPCPEEIVFAPMEAGDYTLSITARDADGVTTEAQTSRIRASAPNETPEEYFTYAANGKDMVKITGYTGDAAIVVIPSTIGGLTVNQIAENAFKSNTVITSVNVPKTVQTVGNYAFQGCTSLTAVNFEDLAQDDLPLDYGLKEIGEYAFKGCTSLRSVHLADTVTAIGNRVFDDCELLTAINYPMALTTRRDRDHGAFHGCVRLTKLEIPEGVTTVAAGVFCEMPALKEVTLPSTVVRLDNANNASCGVFSGCPELTTINLPEGLTEIGSHAFQNCTSLPDPAFPKTLQKIGDYAFEGCASFAAISFYDLMAGDDSLDYGLKEIGDYAFKGCTSLRSVHLADTVTTICNRVFDDCERLTEINYPKSLTTRKDWEHGSFHGCVRLTKLEIPEGVTTVAAGVFCEMPALKEVILPSTVVQLDNANNASCGVFSGCPELTTINLPEGLTEIGGHAFQNCTSLPDPAFPKTLQKIGVSAFEGCTSFVTISFYDLVAGDNSQDYGLKEIGDYAFRGCTSLRSVHLADTVTAICNRVFDDCERLTDINYPMSLTTRKDWDRGSFHGCVRLTKLEIPEGVTTVAAGVFCEMPALQEVILPSTVVQLDNANNASCGVFSNCPELTTINLPEGLTEIGGHAFQNCSSLPDPVFPKTLQKIGVSAFEGCTSFVTISFYDLVAGDNSQDYGLKEIGDYAFRGCTSLRSVHLADTVTAICNRVFDDCERLTDINYPKSLTTRRDWDRGSFHGCVRLTKLEIPEGITTVAAGVFCEMPALQEVVLPSTVVRLDNANNASCGVFSNCPELTTIKLSKSLKEIGTHAFHDCPALGWTYVPSSVKIIADNAFLGFGADLVFESEYEAFAIDYAKSKGIPYYYLSLTDHKRPSGTLYLGHDFNLYGYVRTGCSGLPGGDTTVTTVTATLYDGDGNVLKSVTVNPYETDYNIASGLNSKFDFASLPLGNYAFSMSGSTEITSELFYRTSFRIIKEPVSVKLSGVDVSDYLKLGTDKPLTGTMSANYPITAVEVTFSYDAIDENDNIIESSTVTYSDSSTGNGRTYDLSKLNAKFYAEKNAFVTVQIVVTADGQDKTVLEAAYIVTDSMTPNGLVLDKAKLNAFIADASNKNFFNNYSGYVWKVADHYAKKGDDKLRLTMYLWEQNGYAAGKFEENFCSFFLDMQHNNSYYINLYKDEIVNFIEYIGSDWTDMVGYDEALSYQVKDAIRAYPRWKNDMLKELRNLTGISKNELKMVEKLIEQIDIIKPILDAVSVADDFEDFSELVFHVMQDYTCGLNVLDYLANQYQSNDEQDVYYQKALQELRELYVGDYLFRVDKLFQSFGEAASEAAIKLGEQQISALFKLAIENIFGADINFVVSLVKIFWNTYKEKTDFYKGPKDYTLFTTYYRTYCNALFSYQEHFEKVSQGDRSDEAVQDLMTSFNVTRLAGMRMLQRLDHMQEVPGIDQRAWGEYSKLNDYKNYFYIKP